MSVSIEIEMNRFAFHTQNHGRLINFRTDDFDCEMVQINRPDPDFQ